MSETPENIVNQCAQANHMSTRVGNKLYTIGGYDAISFDSSNSANSIVSVSNSHLRVYDFSSTTTFSLTTTDIGTAIRIPDDVPRRKWANFWASADQKSLYLWGGAREVYPIMQGEGTLNDEGNNYLYNNSTVPREWDGDLWKYSIEEDTWEKVDGVDQRGNSVMPLSQALKTRDEIVPGKQWFWGGILEQGPWLDSNGTLIGGEFVGPVLQGSLIAWEEEEGRFTNYTLSGSGGGEGEGDADSRPKGSTQLGGMVHLKGVGEEGVLVAFAGGDGDNRKSMETVRVFDIKSSTWFTQSTSTSTGDFPQPRVGFCHGLAVAPDGSSYNIYVTGGRETDPAALDDVYVLTIPAFTWVYMGTANVPKVMSTCEVMGNGTYLVMYGGRPGNEAYSTCDEEELERLQMYDMVKGGWTRDWTVRKGQGYEVPEKVSEIIGGGPKGGATLKAPLSGSGFSSPILAKLFENMEVAPGVGTPNNTTNDPSTNDPSTGNPNTGTDQGKSSNAPIIGGAVGGVVVLLLLALLAFFLYRRRKRNSHSNEVAQLPASGAEGGGGGHADYPHGYSNPPPVELSSPHIAGHNTIPGPYKTTGPDYDNTHEMAANELGYNPQTGQYYDTKPGMPASPGLSAEVQGSPVTTPLVSPEDRTAGDGGRVPQRVPVGPYYPPG